MVAAGITSGTVTAETRINCTGRYEFYDDYRPRCWIYPGSHGQINSMGALQVSCNCYFYELGRLMGIDMMNEYCTLYGLGQYTGIELGEKKGILAGPQYREENGLEGWTAGNTISAAIGQSDNTFTPIQVATYVSTVLNGGTRYAAHLLKAVYEYGAENPVYTTEPQVLSTVGLTSAAVAAAKQGMRQMVEASSAISGYMKDVPVIVGGKTGTAELGGSSEENGLFVCAAPYNAPDIVVTAVLEHSGGGTYAAMAASYVLDAYYGVD
jgi:penicillin-binding protein 2